MSWGCCIHTQVHASCFPVENGVKEYLYGILNQTSIYSGLGGSGVDTCMSHPEGARDRCSMLAGDQYLQGKDAIKHTKSFQRRKNTGNQYMIPFGKASQI